MAAIFSLPQCVESIACVCRLKLMKLLAANIKAPGYMAVGNETEPALPKLLVYIAVSNYLRSRNGTYFVKFKKDLTLNVNII